MTNECGCIFCLDYCRDFGPSSSVLLFAYRGSCYSLTNQAVTWSQADKLCQNHFQRNGNKNQGGLALFEDGLEFDYIRQIVGDFNRSATEFGAYIGFSYRNRKINVRINSLFFIFIL
jgi:hypothetical protein